MSDRKAREAARLAFAMKEVSATHVSFESKIDAAIDAYLAVMLATDSPGASTQRRGRTTTDAEPLR